MRTVNDAAIALMKSFEGLRLESYQDQHGIWTIGYGDTGPDVGPGMVWTEAQAEAAYAARINREFAPWVERETRDVPTSDNQFGAMVSLAYNIGDKAFGTTSVLHFHRLKNYTRAAASFDLWDKVEDKATGELVQDDGLLRRRRAEAALYLTPPTNQEPVA